MPSLLDSLIKLLPNPVDLSPYYGLDDSDTLNDAHIAALVEGRSLYDDPEFGDWATCVHSEAARPLIDEAVATLREELVARDDDRAVDLDSNEDSLRENLLTHLRAVDTGDVVADIAERTIDVRMIAVALDEDRADEAAAMPVDELLALLDLAHTPGNREAIEELRDNCNTTFTVAWWVFDVPVLDLYRHPEGVVVVDSPALAYGDPFSGAFWVTEMPDPTIIDVPREQLRRDGTGDWYSVDSVMGEFSLHRCQVHFED